MPSSSPHWQSRNATAGVEDMVLLRQLNDDAIVENLRKRLGAKAIFTYIGPVLVIVNPFAEVEKFGEQQMEQYQGAAQYENPPHLFATADAMFRNVLIDRERQCVIISGESGAGKTVAAKHIMSYLAYSSGGGQRVQRVKESILKSNPLLEAFGNAATSRNWNSSRFGKYVEIVFSSGGEPLGGRISSFLLEKSRVVQTAKGERNFHIFYQLLQGADPELRRQLGLSTPDYYNLLNCSGCFEADGTDDRKDFAETMDAMRAAGLDRDVQVQCLAVVAATLHIGNVSFVESPGDGFASVADEEYLQFPAFLLGLTPEAIKEKLTRRQLQSKWGNATEQVEVRHNQEQAAYTRNAWAKALYARLFDFLVAAVNTALDVDTRRHSMDLSIGVLDIYGFEVFERNGFEQFCINFVNEKLQQIFVELTLKAEQEEYQSEGIQWTPVEFFNNKVVCELIEAKRPPGIMPILDDVCAQIHGQSEGVDEKMLTKLAKQLQGHEHFRPGAACFVVRHYAGEVVYQVDGFCDRNRDILNADLVQLMMGSTSQFMQKLFADCATAAEPNKKPTSASAKIRSQANHLMDSLMRCVPHYVRCIKPNERKRALDFDEERVLHQVRYLGLRENIRVRRAGFVYRRPFERFLWRYAIVCPQTWPRWRGEPRQGCELICSSAQLGDSEFRLGRSKIFIRNPESLFLLEEARERKYDGFARIIQRTFRRFAAKRHLIRQKDEASELLRGLKERNQHSLERRFVADYIGLEQRPGLQAIVGRRERVHFAAALTKYDRRFKTSRVDVLLTGKCLYLVGREPLKSGLNKGKLVEAVKRQIQLAQIRAVTISPLQDDFLLLSVTDSHCSLLETPLKTELLAALNKRCKERTGHALPLQFRDRLVVQLKPISQTQRLFSTAAALLGGTERYVEFRHAPQQGQAQHQQRIQATPTGRTLLVLIAKGLPPDSRPSGQRRFLATSGTSTHSTSSHPNGRAAGPIRLAPHQPVPQQHGAIAAQLQQKNLANGAAAFSQRGQPHHQPPQHPQAQQQRPPPLKPKPVVKPRGPLLRTLYPYEAQDTDELSFGKDQMIELVGKDDSGWWTGRLNGRSGLLPANYVEEV